jgi:hypothetical protein
VAPSSPLRPLVSRPESGASEVTCA